MNIIEERTNEIQQCDEYDFGVELEEYLFSDEICNSKVI